MCVCVECAGRMVDSKRLISPLSPGRKCNDNTSTLIMYLSVCINQLC